MIMRLDPFGPEAGEIEEIAQKLRLAEGLPKEPSGVVAQSKGKQKPSEAKGASAWTCGDPSCSAYT